MHTGCTEERDLKNNRKRKSGRQTYHITVRGGERYKKEVWPP